MTKRKPIEAYSDVLLQLDLAIQHNGLRLPFENAAKAIAHRHRLYRGRQTFFYGTENPKYNDLYIQLEQTRPNGQVVVLSPRDEIEKDEPACLVIRLNSRREVPQMQDLDGNPITVTETEVEDLWGVGDVKKELGLE